MLKWILGFLLACCSIYFLPAPVEPIWCLALLITSGGLLFLLKSLKKQLANSKSRLKTKSALAYFPLLIFTSGFVAGLAWLSLHSQWRLQGRLQLDAPQETIIKARIASIPAVYEQSLHFKAIVEQPLEFKHKKLKLSWYQYEDFVNSSENSPSEASEKVSAQSLSQSLSHSLAHSLSQKTPKLGEIWQFRVRLKPVYNALNSAGYDGEKQDFIDKIAARGSINNIDSKRLASAPTYSLGGLRQRFYDELSYFDNAGIFQALILGEKALIPANQKQQVRALGISHLLAISGLHIGIIAGLVLWLAIKLASRINFISRRISPVSFGLVLSSLAAFAYSALAGFSIPTLRALIMWLAFAISLMAQNRQSLVVNLGAALLLILVWDPVAVLSASFWLTFFAVFVIGLCISGRVVKTVWWKQLVLIQIAISLGMFLLSLLIFQEASLVATLVNLLLIPVFSFVFLPLLFIAVLLKLAGWSALLDFIDRILTVSFSLNAEAVKDLLWQQYIPLWLCCVLFAVFILLLLPLGKLKFLPITALLFVALFGWHHQVRQHNFKLVVFDLGHGLSSLLYNQNHAILYDTGFANDYFSNAELYLIPSLRKLGIKKIDLLIISHPDMDHAGGAKAISQAFKVNKIITADSCPVGTAKLFDNLKLDFVYANPQAVKSNNQSCVVKASSKQHKVLLTGDIERKVELKIAKRNYLYALSADILLSPHHGSNTSSSYALIKAVSPQLAIHVTDRFNRYGMPHEKVQKRYRDLKVQQLITGCSGQLSIDLATGKRQSVREKRRIWRNPPC